jgi:hypothetical protein
LYAQIIFEPFQGKKILPKGFLIVEPVDVPVARMTNQDSPGFELFFTEAFLIPPFTVEAARDEMVEGQRSSPATEGAGRFNHTPKISRKL